MKNKAMILVNLFLISVSGAASETCCYNKYSSIIKIFSNYYSYLKSGEVKYDKHLEKVYHLENLFINTNGKYLFK